MAAYDSPGFTSPIPGDAGFSAREMTAPGTAPPGRPDTSAPLPDRLQQGTVGSSAVVTPPGGSLVNADIVTVGPLDTLVPSAAQSYGAGADPLTGIGGELGSTGAGQGAPRGPHHPGSSHPELAP